MPSPGPPDVLMAEPWSLQTAPGGPTADFYFDVDGAVPWARPEGDAGRMAVPLCGGPPTLLTYGNVLAARRFQVTVRLHPGPNRDTRLTTLEALWKARGPYLLTSPTIDTAPLTVICDASQSGLQYVPQNGARLVQVAFQEQ
jgi:hypothetical protein